MLQLTQHNGILNSDGRTLDLLLTNIDDIRVSITHCNVPFVSEDKYHPALDVDLTISSSSCHQYNFPTAETLSYNFRKANFVNLYNEVFLADWSFLDTINNANDALDAFYASLYNIIDSNVPKKQNSKSTNFPIWFSQELKRNLKLKEKFRNKWKSTNNATYLNKYLNMRRTTKLHATRDYETYIQKVQNNIKSNPTELWNHIRHKKGSTRIPCSISSTDKNLNNPLDIVNGFADYFSRAGTTSLSPTITDSNIPSNCESFSLSRVTEDELIQIMAKLPNKWTSGDDSIPSFIVKDCRLALAKPLAAIINIAIETCSFPERWKVAKITPVHKKGDKSHISNYRPISILSNFAKVFEQVIYNSLYAGIKQYISPNQHGLIELINELIVFFVY